MGIDILSDSAVEETDRTTMGRAWAMWSGGARPLDLNPHTSGWPALSFYLTLLFQLAYRAYVSAASGSQGAAEFVRHVQAHPDQFFLWGRALSVPIGVLTVYLAYRLAARFGGAWLGLLTGLLLALNAAHVLASQHVGDPNLLSQLFILLAISALLTIRERGRTRDSLLAGVWIGLAGASKYVPLVLVIPLVAVHAGHPVGKSGLRSLVGSRNLWIALGGTGLAFVAASPYAVFDWRTSLVDLTAQSGSLLSGWVGQETGPVALTTYLTRTIPSLIGWLAYPLAVVGLVLLSRDPRGGAVLVWSAVVLFAAIGALRVAQERYVLILLPFLLMGAGVTAIQLLAWLDRPSRGKYLVRAASSILVTCLCAWPVWSLVQARMSLRLPDSRHAARAWIAHNIDPARPMVLDLYGPVFNSAGFERLALAWPFFASQAELVRAAYFPQWLEGIDYYVLSGELAGRFRTNQRTWATEAAYYAWLRAHARALWTSVGGKMSGPGIDVLELPRGISTLDQRDRLWSSLLSEPMDKERLSAWCRDMSEMFILARNYARAGEWAKRGLSVASSGVRSELLGTLAYAQIQRGRLADGEVTARLGILEFPGEYRLHLYRGLALDQLGLLAEALREYRTSLSLNPNQDEGAEVRAAIARLQAGSSVSGRAGQH